MDWKKLREAKRVGRAGRSPGRAPSGDGSITTRQAKRLVGEVEQAFDLLDTGVARLEDLVDRVPALRAKIKRALESPESSDAPAVREALPSKPDVEKP